MGESLESFKYEDLKRKHMDQHYLREYPDLPNLNDEEDEDDDNELEDDFDYEHADQFQFESAADRREIRRRPESIAATIRDKPALTAVTSSRPSTDGRVRDGKSSISSGSIAVGCVGVIIVLMAICVGYWYWIRVPSVEDKRAAFNFEKVRVEFEADLPKIKQEFGKQSTATWKSIMTAVRMTTSKQEPKSPGVISLIPSAMDVTTENTVRCLARKLALTLQRSYNDTRLLEIDGVQINKRDLGADVMSIDLDEQILRNLQTDANHVVLISNFDRLPARSGMLLHGLCDTDSAPVKQAIYVLTVGRRSDADVNVVDAQVTTAWKSELSEEERQSLEARIGNNIALIVPETKDTLDQVC